MRTHVPDFKTMSFEMGVSENAFAHPGARPKIRNIDKLLRPLQICTGSLNCCE